MIHCMTLNGNFMRESKTLTGVKRYKQNKNILNDLAKIHSSFFFSFHFSSFFTIHSTHGIGESMFTHKKASSFMFFLFLFIDSHTGYIPHFILLLYVFNIFNKKKIICKSA